jgi:hypothetical protein
MLSQEQLKQLISENHSLQVQLEESNLILIEREEELELMKESASRVGELKSLLETRLDELHSMQNHIGEKEQEAEGAVERELELQQELTEAARLQQQYDELAREYTYLETRFNDIQEEVKALKSRNMLLQQIAVRIGELESHLANTVMERDELAARVGVLERSAGRGDLETGR